MPQRHPFHDLTGYPKIPNLRRYLDRCRWPLRKSCIPYEQLVLGAADPLERATAATFVHLLWLELLQQFGARQLPRGPDAAQFRLRRA